MQAIQLEQPGGLENLAMAEVEPRDPGPGEIRVRNHASSLNFHDYAVVTGMIAVDDKRIPMSDGAGVVEAVGDGVGDFQVGDRVMSSFFPNWEDGAPALEKIIGVPGDTVEIRRGTVFVNGEELDEPYVQNKGRSNERLQRVPEDSYFVLGDNRRASSDSRDWGMVPADHVTGKAWVSFWPLDQLQFLSFFNWR